MINVEVPNIIHLNEAIHHRDHVRPIIAGMLTIRVHARLITAVEDKKGVCQFAV